MPHVLVDFLYSQLFVVPPAPTQSFAGQTIIVTGASAGLGLACVIHLARLEAKRVILAVRSLEKGSKALEAIRAKIPASTPTQLDLRYLDLSKYDSIRDFAKSVIEEYPHIDGLVQNAGILTDDWRTAEGMEEQMMVHVVGPQLLALMLRSKMAETAHAMNRPARITYVGSDMHHFASLNGWADRPSEQGIFTTLANREAVPVDERNKISKLFIVLTARELAARVDKLHQGNLIVTIANPGFCCTENHREFRGFKWFVEGIMELCIGRKAEVGSRMLVAGLTADGKTCQGAYMSDGMVHRPSGFVESKEGQNLQEIVWKELMNMLGSVEPGIAI